MQYKSLQIAAIALSASLVSAKNEKAAPHTERFDFQDLQPSYEGSTIDEYCGMHFKGLKVARVSNEKGLLDGIFGDRSSSSRGSLGPTCNIAYLDPTSPEGCSITAPEGSYLESIDYICCSTMKGESIFEGHGCKQVPCEINVDMFGKNKANQKVKSSQSYTYEPHQHQDSYGPAPQTVEYPTGIIQSIINGADGFLGGIFGGGHDGGHDGGHNGGHNGGFLGNLGNIGFKKTEKRDPALPGIQITQDAVTFALIFVSGILEALGSHPPIVIPVGGDDFTPFKA